VNLTVYHWIVMGIMALVLYGVYRLVSSPFRGRGKVSADGNFICPHCGTRGAPRIQAKGSLLIEIILWLCFLVPGIIYSLWRLTTKEPVCPTCAAPGMIPAGSPMGRDLVARFKAPAA
jgi:hypothetical protein